MIIIVIIIIITINAYQNLIYHTASMEMSLTQAMKSISSNLYFIY